MAKDKTATLSILLGLSLLGVAVMAWSSGYRVGSDIAARENAAEAR